MRLREYAEEILKSADGEEETIKDLLMYNKTTGKTLIFYQRISANKDATLGNPDFMFEQWRDGEESTLQVKIFYVGDNLFVSVYKVSDRMNPQETGKETLFENICFRKTEKQDFSYLLAFWNDFSDVKYVCKEAELSLRFHSWVQFYIKDAEDYECMGYVIDADENSCKILCSTSIQQLPAITEPVVTVTRQGEEMFQQCGDKNWELEKR